MAINLLPSGNNPQQPFAISEVFLPDQLIAGKIFATDSVIVSGSSVLLRGTVLGQAKFGTAAASAGKTAGTATITINAQAAPAGSVVPAIVNGDTLTIGNGTTTTVITFNTLPTGALLQQQASAAGVSPEQFSIAPPAGTQWIAATIAAQTAALVEYLNTQTADANLGLMTYAISGAGSNVITATSNIFGTAANAYTLATSDTTAFTLSGATFTGGTNNTGTSTVSAISGGPQLQAGPYLVTVTTTSQTSPFTVVDPHGETLPNGLVGTAYKNAQLNFTITAGGTVTAGDTFVITGSPTNVGSYKLAVATAGDGTENPSAVLVDYCDPTGGPVTAGVYLEAELNGNALIFDSSFSLAAIKAAFRPLGLYVKASVSALDPT